MIVVPAVMDVVVGMVDVIILNSDRGTVRHVAVLWFTRHGMSIWINRCGNMAVITVSVGTYGHTAWPDLDLR